MEQKRDVDPRPEREGRQKILFLCTHNSCRSQMAEGWAHHLLGEQFESYSAGIAPTRVDPYAIRVMAEAGVDISLHHAKSTNDIRNIGFDYVVTREVLVEERQVPRIAGDKWPVTR